VTKWSALVGDDEVVELERALSDVAVGLFGADTVEATLEEIVKLAEKAIEGCDAAGILIIDAGTPTTVAASNPLASTLDEMQITAGEGPCVDAASTGATLFAQDLAEGDRWPTFAPSALGAGIRCVLTYSLSGERLSSLNLYARLPTAFGVTDRAQAQLFATLARLALDSARGRAAEEYRSEHLREALRTRELIGQAQGILMEREHITADQAFDVLRRASQHLNRKLREIAETLVDTGESPDTATARRLPHRWGRVRRQATRLRRPSAQRRLRRDRRRPPSSLRRRLQGTVLMATVNDDSPAPFAIDIFNADGTARFVLRGEVDLAVRDVLGSAVAEAVADGKRVVLDLTAVSLFDCTGIGVIAQAVSGGCEVTVLNPERPVHQALDISGIDSLIRIVDGDGVRGQK
jgi:anti-anti-sigma factor